MRHGIAVSLALAVVALLGTRAEAHPTAKTKIQLTELHCQGCLKKLSKQLMQVPGVATVQGDLKAATLAITHKPGMNPSPRALWEAVEEADHTPTRLDGPSGIFTQKPAQ